MKKLLQIAITFFAIYTILHIIVGFDFNPIISLVTRIIQALLALCLLIYVIKFTRKTNR
ncbi:MULTISPECIES: hypothetical protein [Bacillus]|uniref:hypothetical protein n=1 Tax=Bacillus TaxID=1386 RepID=UPI00027C192D|nr:MULTISPECIES: hypothetical protein [Bacillus]EJV56038.1 hypothetical protein IEO_05539 [Bacillus wiedmannii]MDA1647564.1 hypothetical protein [Bacillus cereus group sp. TH163-1LC]MDA1741841.1 hypothetical protein [Bacillus cereus]MDA1797398.1 hypothetical protein [Bacillus cereus group sp. BY8-1LC]MDA1882804.1 hypothetical protein [Bacillus cereus group sp. BY10-2LC]